MTFEAKITERLNVGGFSAISTVYAYYTPAGKAAHGKPCEHWTAFGHGPAAAPYRTHREREFIAATEAENPGKFDRYLIDWSGCE